MIHYASTAPQIYCAFSIGSQGLCPDACSVWVTLRVHHPLFALLAILRTRTRQAKQHIHCCAHCRYNYTVYQDSEHDRQKIVRNSIETTMEVLDTVSSITQSHRASLGNDTLLCAVPLLCLILLCHVRSCCGHLSDHFHLIKGGSEFCSLLL